MGLPASIAVPQPFLDFSDVGLMVNLRWWPLSHATRARDLKPERGGITAGRR